MAKVNINGHSHQVEVEGDGDLAEVVAMAEGLWSRTVTPERGPAGPAYGFSAERRDSRDLWPNDLDGK